MNRFRNVRVYLGGKGDGHEFVNFTNRFLLPTVDNGGEKGNRSGCFNGVHFWNNPALRLFAGECAGYLSRRTLRMG